MSEEVKAKAIIMVKEEAGQVARAAKACNFYDQNFWKERADPKRVEEAELLNINIQIKLYKKKIKEMSDEVKGKAPLVKQESGEEKRQFCCRFCNRSFYSSHGLAGHQGAHKMEMAKIKAEENLGKRQQRAPTPSLHSLRHKYPYYNNLQPHAKQGYYQQPHVQSALYPHLLMYYPTSLYQLYSWQPPHRFLGLNGYPAYGAANPSFPNNSSTPSNNGSAYSVYELGGTSSHSTVLNIGSGYSGYEFGETSNHFMVPNDGSASSRYQFGDTSNYSTGPINGSASSGYRFGWGRGAGDEPNIMNWQQNLQQNGVMATSWKQVFPVAAGEQAYTVNNSQGSSSSGVAVKEDPENQLDLSLHL